MINQAIYGPEVDHCLLSLMQCWINGLEINKAPKFLMTNPTTSTHSIEIADPNDAVNLYIILLQLEWVVSYFEYALPTSAEYEDCEIPHLELTAESPAWDPYDKDYAAQEESNLEYRGHLISAARSDGPCSMAEMGLHFADAICGEEPLWKLSPVSLQYYDADVTDDDTFGAALGATWQVNSLYTNPLPETYNVCDVHTGIRQGGMDYISLVNCWQIPLHKVKNIVQRMAQCSIRTVLHPTLSMCFHINDWRLHYSRLPCYLFSDTMFSNVQSA
jgi:hypothetical protein